MKQTCKNTFQSLCVCRKDLSNPRCLTVYVNSTDPRLLTTLRQLELGRYIRHIQG